LLAASEITGDESLETHGKPSENFRSSSSCWSRSRSCKIDSFFYYCNDNKR